MAFTYAGLAKVPDGRIMWVYLCVVEERVILEVEWWKGDRLSEEELQTTIEVKGEEITLKEFAITQVKPNWEYYQKHPD